MAENPALRALWGPAVVAVTFVATAFTALFGFAMGVLVGDAALGFARPAAALMTALAAALAAAWTSTLLAPDRTRTRLGAVLRWTLAAAFVGLLVFYALRALVFRAEGPLAGALAPLVVLVAGAAAFAALRNRKPQESLRRDALLSLALLAALPILFFGTIGLACLMDACGA